MNEYYTLKQAMERLALRSINAFRQLERKYPEGFVNIHPDRYARVKTSWYDRVALDNFAKTHGYLAQEKPAETYSHKQAMEKLGLTSTADLRQLKREYPHALVATQQRTGKKTATRYDKEALDKFVASMKSLKKRGQS